MNVMVRGGGGKSERKFWERYEEKEEEEGELERRSLN